MTDIVNELLKIERAGDIPPKGHPALAGRAADEIGRAREALRTIADIAEGSTTANSLQNIAKIARAALPRS